MSRPPRAPRSVAAHLMWWQVLVVLLLVATAVALAALDARRDARESAAARAAAVATSVADSPDVRDVAVSGVAATEASAELQPFAEQVRRETGTSFVVVMAPDGTRWTHPDPAQVGRTYLGTRAGALAGGTVVETYTGTLGPSVRVVVPVRADGTTGDVVALVSTGITVAQLGQGFAADLRVIALAGLGVLVLAVGGSALVARRARRITLGLAGPELARLVTTYDAVLRSVREGLVLLDDAGRVRLVNDAARALLDLPPDDEVLGRTPGDLGLAAGLVRVLEGPADAHGTAELDDEVVLTEQRVLVASARTARPAAGAPAGAGGRVVTLRDRTDLLALTDELETTRSLADALRSQAHEFANRLHTVVALVELGRGAEAVELATDELAAAQALTDRVVGAVGEPVVAALLLGASARAAERGVELVVADGSQLDEGDLARAGVPVRDVLTVAGNLLDNAVDAAAARPRPLGAVVRVLLRTDADGALRCQVDDSGPGLAPDDAARAFRRGWSTKADDERPQGRGLGLALVGQAVHRHAGEVAVTRSDLGGARFAVVLPAGRAAAAAPATAGGAA
ncbi:ATP-binding protein [Pseudokineococcus basanitobsidens]|uniref:histidine kinase n=1 Tax=Pseudokineococcus basanitobsidens TaxID=1926649 RepID=A0ABU8RFS9_9ACTN